MATTVRITETYDLKTSVGKMGIIGIHTPRGEQIRKLYPGLVKSHKFIRFLSCDVVGACASVLPADPLQVGVTAGDVAPEDMFNPILYKACSNTSFDTLVSRVMQSGADLSYLGSVAKDENASNEGSNFNIYYSLLAQNGEFRKSMPQSGFAIKGLKPLCHTLISSYGNLATIGNDVVDEAETGDDISVPQIADVMTTTPGSYTSVDPARTPEAVTFRGKSVLMPKLPIHYNVEAWDEIPNLNLVKTMVAVLIVPPARLHEFYYRMRVTWTIRFEEVCSTLTAASSTAWNAVGPLSYQKEYSYVTSKSDLENQENSVDATDVSINKVMES